jgi:hypothetical protein
MVMLGLFQGLPSAQAQVAVQNDLVLPRQGVFAASTSVVVPDRGSAMIAGASSRSASRSEFRPGGTRGFAGSAAASEVGAQVTIVDAHALDPALGIAGAGEPAAQRAGPFSAALRRYASDPVAKAGDERRGRAGKKADDEAAIEAGKKEAEAAELVRRGRDAEARGKPNVARIYYQTAERLSPGSSAAAASPGSGGARSYGITLDWRVVDVPTSQILRCSFLAGSG